MKKMLFMILMIGILLIMSKGEIYAANVYPGNGVSDNAVASEADIPDPETVDEEENETTVIENTEQIGQLIYLDQQLVDGLAVSTNIIAKLLMVTTLLLAITVGILIMLLVFRNFM